MELQGGIALHSTGLMRVHTQPSQSHSHQHQRIASTTGPPALMSHQSFQSHYSSYSHSSARDTQSTQATSTSTLFGPTPTATPVNGGPIEASDNVLNKRADKDTSLFQRCLNLQMRLRLIPGFARWMADEEDKLDDDADPVTLLWRTFRRGYPLVELYNALDPRVPLSIPNSKNDEKSMKKHEKMATYKFLEACLNALGMSQGECFIIGDLYGDDTTGFVKVPRLPSFYA